MILAKMALLAGVCIVSGAGGVLASAHNVAHESKDPAPTGQPTCQVPGNMERTVVEDAAIDEALELVQLKGLGTATAARSSTEATAIAELKATVEALQSAVRELQVSCQKGRKEGDEQLPFNLPGWHLDVIKKKITISGFDFNVEHGSINVEHGNINVRQGSVYASDGTVSAKSCSISTNATIGGTLRAANIAGAGTISTTGNISTTGSIQGGSIEGGSLAIVSGDISVTSGNVFLSAAGGAGKGNLILNAELNSVSNTTSNSFVCGANNAVTGAMDSVAILGGRNNQLVYATDTEGTVLLGGQGALIGAGGAGVYGNSSVFIGGQVGVAVLGAGAAVGTSNTDGVITAFGETRYTEDMFFFSLATANICQKTGETLKSVQIPATDKTVTFYSDENCASSLVTPTTASRTNFQFKSLKVTAR